MKPIICVTDFSNTEIRIEKLRKLIDSIPEKYDIMLISHASIPTDIIKKCKIFIFDKENDGLFNLKYKQKESYHTENFSIYYHTYGSNVSWVPSILRIWSIALSSLKSLGYNVVHLIEYDTVIHDFDLFENNLNHLKEYDVVLYNHPNNEKTLIEWTTGNIISINLDKITWDKLKYDLKTVEKKFNQFYKEKKLPCAERVIFDFFWKDLNIKLLERDLDLKNWADIRLSHSEVKENPPIICVFEKNGNFNFFVKNSTKNLLNFEFIINKNNCLSFDLNANTWMLRNLINVEDLKSLKIYCNKIFYFEFDLNNEYDKWLINSSNFIEK